MAHAEPEGAELDEDGLVVQRYESVVLVVLPPVGFGDQILRYARSSLYNVHVGTTSVSTLSEEFVKGRLQDEFLVDGPLSSASMEAYSGILVAGSEGANPLAEEAHLLELLRAAQRDDKLVAGWGNALSVFARAGIVKGRRVTGDEASGELAERAGGRYTGRQVEVSKNLVTAFDEGAGMRFGQALADLVRI